MKTSEAVTIWRSLREKTRMVQFVGLGLSLSLPILVAALIWYQLDRENAYVVGRAGVVAQAVQRQLEERLGWLSEEMREVVDAASGASPARPARAVSDNRFPLTDIVIVHEGRAIDAQGRPTDAGWLPRPDPGHQSYGLTIGVPVRDAHGENVMVPLAWDGYPGWRVGARIGSNWFAQLLGGYELGAHGVIGLVHGDRVLVARSLENQRYAGLRMDHSPMFHAALMGQPSGNFVESAKSDGIERQYVFLRVPNSPLIVGVGMERRHMLIVWGRFAAVAFLAALVLGALWFWVSRLYAREHAGQAKLLRDLLEQSRRVQMARRIATLGDWSWDLDSGELNWSDEIFAIYGMAPRPLQMKDVSGHIHPDDRQRMLGQIERMQAGKEPVECVFRVVRPDGDVRTVYSCSEWVDGMHGRHRFGIQQDITELTRAREQLELTHKEYQFLFKHNPLPMCVYDRESLQFLAVNHAILGSYGYTREEMLALSVLDIRPAEEVAASKTVLLDRMKEYPQGTVWTHARKDGSLMRMRVFGEEIDFDGHPARMVVLQDVTQSEAAEQRFQLIARATSDAIWDWDVLSGVTWRSDSFFTLFGYERDEVVSNLRGWDDLLHPDDRERAVASVQREIESGATEWEDHYRFRRKDGTYADVLDRGVLLRNANGNVVRVVGGMLDITQRNRDEVKLRLLRRAVESVASGIVIADAAAADLPLVYVNPAFEEITGYSSGEVLGRNCRFLQGDDREQPGIEQLRNAIRERTDVRVLLRNYRKDGHMFWNEFTLAPVCDDEGVLTHFVGIQSDVSDRQRAQEQLAFRATHDALTGLPNRELLLDRLRQAIRNAERHPRPVAVLFIDLDNFKLINDSLGHSVGDDTLREFSRRLQDTVCDTDTVGRFGGDEFVILLTERADDLAVVQAITKVNAALAKPFDVSGVTHYLTVSIGWCRYPEHGKSADELLMHSDMAMFKAKQGGRNRVVAYQSTFDSHASDRLRLVDELRQALLREEFVLAFQPLFGSDGAPVALEALVRWQHPERGLVPPDKFIGVCEDSGLIVPLGRWVLHEAARQYARLEAEGFGRLRIAVNVSSAQFQQDLYADVESAVRSHNLPAGALELELTESVVMDDPETAIDLMQRLRSLGVSISVDDFGTGYSSLAYLKRLPIQRLKIDRSFVRDLSDNQEDQVICNAIIQLAHSLGLATVAEGVETQAQRDWLVARGCDELQGYLLGRPQLFDAMLAALKEG